MHPLFTSLICLLPQSLVRLVILLCLCSLRIAQWRLCRTSWGCLEYLINWEVYSPEERSWDNILDQTLLAIFHVNHSTTQMDGSSDVLGLQSGAWDCHSTSHSLYFHFPFNLSFTGLTKNYHWPLLQCYIWLITLCLPSIVDYSSLHRLPSIVDCSPLTAILPGTISIWLWSTVRTVFFLL